MMQRYAFFLYLQIFLCKNCEKSEKKQKIVAFYPFWVLFVPLEWILFSKRTQQIGQKSGQPLQWVAIGGVGGV